MMELFRSWVMGIAAVSILCAAAMALTANTTARQAVRMLAAVALLAAVLWPVKKLDPGRLMEELADYGTGYEQAEERADTVNRDLTASLAAERLSEYVEGRARTLGIECRAQVTVDWTEDGTPLPRACRITTSSALTQAQRDAISALVAGELGISEDSQAYMVDE